MFVIYIKDKDWNNLTQIFEARKIEVKLKLNDISSASFELSNLDKNNKYEYLKEFNLVYIYKLEDNEEKLILEWTIRSVEADLNKSKILVNDKLFLLKNKILYSDTTYTDKTVDYILLDLLDNINSRYETNITLDCWITDTITKTYKTWKTILDILKDIALNWYEFEIKDNILTFKETIWEDKSVWENFVEFTYDINSLDSRTIDNAKSEYDSDNLANAIIVNWSWNVINQTSIDNFWRTEKYFISWDKAEIISERKDSIKELELTPISNDLFQVNLWDVIKVYINAWNDIMFYDWNLKVIEKQFSSWDLDRIKIRLSKWKVKTLNLIETIQDLKNRTKNLEI